MPSASPPLPKCAIMLLLRLVARCARLVCGCVWMTADCTYMLPASTARWGCHSGIFLPLFMSVSGGKHLLLLNVHCWRPLYTGLLLSEGGVISAEECLAETIERIIVGKWGGGGGGL